MKTRLHHATLATLAGAGEDDPIVWQMSGSRPDGTFMHKVLTKSCRANLVKHFGEVWVKAYLANARQELTAWEAGCDVTTIQ